LVVGCGSRFPIVFQQSLCQSPGAQPSSPEILNSWLGGPGLPVWASGFSRFEKHKKACSGAQFFVLFLCSSPGNPDVPNGHGLFHPLIQEKFHLSQMPVESHRPMPHWRSGLSEKSTKRKSGIEIVRIWGANSYKRSSETAFAFFRPFRAKKDSM
jgi:hypothetical protein